MPLCIASAIRALKSSPRRSRTMAKKAWLSAYARATLGCIWHSWSRYVCASADRLAAGQTISKETARADGPWGRVYGERCDAGACPASAARRSRVMKRQTVRAEWR
jgi:hypothetical protein